MLWPNKCSCKTIACPHKLLSVYTVFSPNGVSSYRAEKSLVQSNISYLSLVQPDQSLYSLIPPSPFLQPGRSRLDLGVLYCTLLDSTGIEYAIFGSSRLY